MIIEIKYRDKTIWESVSGNVTDWTNYSKKYKNERVQPFYLAPEIITDRWNGLDYDIQHLTHDAFSFSMFIKESEVKNIVQMKSCSDIQILEYSEDDSGAILNKTYILDLQKSDYFQVSEPEPVNGTSSSKVTITFRTNRTIINKTLPVLGTNYLTIDKNTTAWEFGFSGTIPGKITALSSFSIASLYTSILQRYVRHGNEWVKSGSALNIGGTGSHEDVTNLDADSVAVIIDGYVGRYTYSNGLWTLTGNLFNDPALTPTIAGLSSTRIAVYDSGSALLRTLDFDGTDWSKTGNSKSIPSAASVYICKMTATKIAMMDLAASISDYDFDGTDWTVNQDITLISAGNGAICRLSDSRIASYVENSGNFRSYTLTSDWALDAGTLNVGGTGSALAGLTDNEVFLTASTSGNYNYGVISYYSDYDLIDWPKDTEDIKVSWSDGSDKVAQKVSKIGYQFLHYLSNEDLISFINLFKSYDLIYLNGTKIDDTEIEQTEIGIDLYRVVIRGVYQVNVNNVELNLSSTYELKIINSINGTVYYYTDYVPELISETPVINTYNNEDGINVQTKGISRVTKQLRFYLSESNAFALKQNFELVGTKTLDTVPILEGREVTPNKLGIDLYEVLVPCVIDAKVNY